MAFLSEADIEQGLLELLQSLGWATTSDDLIGPDGKAPERESHDVVVLHQRLAAAVARLNPHLPMEARSDAIRKLTQSELPNLLEENRRVHQLLTEGVDVEYYANDGVLTAGKVLLLDFDRPENNDWLAVQQLVVISGQHQRRPDVALFVNGLPLAVIELKAPGSAGANLVGAFNQLQTYKQQIAACSKPMPCWSHPTASRRGWDRCRPIWNASCRGAPPMARAYCPRASRSCRH